ncbi:Protein UXT-like protein [Hordeum vulgare]|nr:Protein UXT-like protein [Hordeum vulgare]
MTTAPSSKGKPRTPCKTAAAPKPKKTLTPEQRARKSAKRKGRMHTTDARDETIAAAVVAIAAQQEDTNARIVAATMEALYMLGLNPSQHGLVNAAMAAASTGSPAFPWMVLPDLSCVSDCTPMPGFHVYPQASRLSGECSPEVSMAAPSPCPRPRPSTLTPHRWPVARHPEARGNARGICHLFDGMPATDDEDYMQNLIFEGGAPVVGYDPDETQSQAGRGVFTPRRLEMDAEKQAKMLEMNAEKQAKMLEMEVEKQTKMLEIGAVNAKTKVKEVAFASMMTGVEIMKMNLNTKSSRKRSWFEKMQVDMLKFDDE